MDIHAPIGKTYRSLISGHTFTPQSIEEDIFGLPYYKGISEHGESEIEDVEELNNPKEYELITT